MQGDKARAYEVSLEGAQWFKSIKSGHEGDGCVEVAFIEGGRFVAVRDSVYPGRPAHIYTRHEWDCFLHGARQGEFNLPEA